MKQETLEEAAEKQHNYTSYEAFIRGAEWQQEQDKNKYSEEDLREAIKKARDISDGKDCFDAEDISGCTEVCTYGWKFNMSEDSIIEQFKNK